jgi:hypothetical protein
VEEKDDLNNLVQTYYLINKQIKELEPIIPDEIKLKIKQLEEQLESLKMGIINEMNSRNIKIHENKFFTVKDSSSITTTIDKEMSELLEKDLPDVYSKYSKIRTTNKITVKKKKEEK